MFNAEVFGNEVPQNDATLAIDSWRFTCFCSSCCVEIVILVRALVQMWFLYKTAKKSSQAKVTPTSQLRSALAHLEDSRQWLKYIN